MPYLQALAGPPPVQTQTSWAQVSRPHPQCTQTARLPGRCAPGQNGHVEGPAWLCRMLVPGTLTAPCHPLQPHAPTCRRGPGGVSLSSSLPTGWVLGHPCPHASLGTQVGALGPGSSPRPCSYLARSYLDPSRPELWALNRSPESLGPASTGVARAASSPWAIPG